jgi:L-amino acid N-acyltransferase YncA
MSVKLKSAGDVIMAQESKLESTPIHGRSEGLPDQIALPNGRQVALRLMSAADRAQILAFARSLPPDDLLFLRTDITQPAIVDQWIVDLERANTITVLAETEVELAGYASLHLEEARWTRRVGEIRVQVAPVFRGQGLGRRLTHEIFQLGQSRDIKKMAAMMTPDQTGARAAFEKLGFQVEALLQDWVVDRGGRPRDLLIMSYDLEGLNNQA